MLFRSWKRARGLTKEVVAVDDFDKNFGLAVAQSEDWRHTDSQAMAAE